jgi:hypothetical protein
VQWSSELQAQPTTSASEAVRPSVCEGELTG